MVTKVMYQDGYNPKKTWQVCHLKGGFYLKQFIGGIQFGRGLRCSKKYLQSLGVLDFKKLDHTTKTL